MSSTTSTNINIQSTEIGGVSFPSGSILKVEYVNGKKEGAGKVLSKKKMILATVYFHEDELHGYCLFCNEKGQKIKEYVYSIYDCIRVNSELFDEDNYNQMDL